MTSTFRLTRAEFKKIFKRASVYLMALLLVIAVLVSVYIYKPVSNLDKTINYGDNLSVENYYNYFYEKDLSTSKKGIDQSYYEPANQLIAYFQTSNDRDLKINQTYNDLITSFNDIKSATDINVKQVKYNEFKTNLQALYNAYTDFSMFDIAKYPYITYSTTYINSTDNNYYLTANSASIQTLLDKANDINNTPDDMISIIETNDNLNKINKDLKSAYNYIRPTLYALALDIKDNYIEFNNAYNRGAQALYDMESARKNLKTRVEAFETYFEMVTDFEFPIVAINKNLYTEIINTIDSALEALGSAVFTGVKQSFSDYSSLQTSLTNIDIANYFTKTFAEDNANLDFRQIKLKTSTITDFQKIQTKVSENKETIEQTIRDHRTDESIKNIQKCITNYSLLGETYNNYLDYKIKVSLNSELRSDEIVSLYGYKFNEFNIYQADEKLTEYSYYISNNVYENSFNSNYAFMTSTGENPNAFEFMYFSMEICTVIIIIFAMMMICNLITSETESGTIKLLLTRPYKRSKIITAKLLATIFFVIIFVIFSVAISFAGGYFLFGVDMSEILVVFNGSNAVAMSPIALTLINIGSLLLDIIFYVLLALMISILFKNYAGSISTCFVLIIATYALNILFGGAFWYSLLPGPNLHLFKYLGNSFISTIDNMFANIFITPIQSTMNFWYSLLITGAYSLVFTVVSYAVFNKRDF